MHNPKVSIITPSFNQGKFIEETIMSVLNQTYKNIEFIIVDGCSDDETSLILNKYAHLIDIILIEKDNGQADAINKGIKRANGDLITWLNSDDTLTENSIENTVALFNSSKANFIYGDVNLIDKDSKIISRLSGKQIYEPSVFYNLDLPIPQQGSIWKKEVNENIGFLFENLHYVLDRDFFLRICANYNVLYVPQVLGSFRQHFESKSVSLKESWINELPIMYLNLINGDLKDKSAILKKIILSSSLIHCVYISVSQKQFYLGVKYFLKAILIFPPIIFMPHIYFKAFNKIKKIVLPSRFNLI